MSIIAVFVAGVLTFLAPCTLPLLPVYLAYISGIPAVHLSRAEDERVRMRLVLHSIFFVLGFTVIFMLFGLASGFLGSYIALHRDLFVRIAGVGMLLFGLTTVGILQRFVPSGRGVLRVAKGGKVSLASSFGLGTLFAASWSPCIGPILGTVLLVASLSGTALYGSFLLLVFALGIGLPFIAIAYGFSVAEKRIARLTPFLEHISLVGGIILILVGLILLSGRLGVLARYVNAVAGSVINQERVLDYL